MTRVYFSLDYLDAVRSMSAVQTLKQRTFQLLDLSRSDRVLDVACGTGEDVMALAEIVGPGGEAVGIDLNAEMVDEARRRAGASTLPVTFQVGDVYRLEFGDDTFHGVRVERLLHILEQPAEALAEMLRVTRPHGWIVVCEPDWQTLTVDGPNPAITRAVFGSSLRRYGQDTSRQSLARMLGRLGLESIAGTTETLTIAEPRLAIQLFGLREMLFGALFSGAITGPQVATWLLEVEQAAREDRFVASLSGSILCGRKPRRSGTGSRSQFAHGGEERKDHERERDHPASGAGSLPRQQGM